MDTALGYSVAKAQRAAYELAGHIGRDGMFYRRDMDYRTWLGSNRRKADRA